MGQAFVGENPFTRYLGGLLYSQFRTASLASGTFAQFDLTPQTGPEAIVCYTDTNATPGTLTTRTAVQMFADIPGVIAGMTYLLIIRNSSAAAAVLTVAAGTGVTLTGTMTIPQDAARLFHVVMTSNVACTFQSLGTLAAAAA